MSHINVPIKQGTQVTIKDGSYMLAISINSNQLERFPKIEGFNGNLVTLNHTYTVIAVNVPCPTDELSKSLRSQNNCIIKDNETDMIWFCSLINLKTVYSLV